MTSPSPRDEHQSPRTITVSTRSSSRFARLRIRRPGQPAPRPRTRRHPAAYLPPTTTPYDPSLAMELLANTSELPGRKRDLCVVLTNYRHALHALATQALASQNPGT